MTRRRWPERVAAAYPWARRASLTLFALVVLGAVISEHDTVRERLAELAGAVVALNLAAMGLSFLAARATRLHAIARPPRSRSSSAFTTPPWPSRSGRR